MNGHRVRQMTLDEVACRGRQLTSKWLDRTWRPRRPRGLPAIGRDRLREIGRAHFFAWAVSDATPVLIAKRAPAARTALLSEADALLDGRFNLLGYRDLDFGTPIDWHIDPVAGRRAPLVHWSRLDPLHFAQVGDSKVVWELNRHQWMVRLAQAYRVTADERYAQAVVDRIQEWMAANPPGIGINWASSLEVSYRLIAWCWCLFLLDGSRALSADCVEALTDQIWLHARHVERYLSYYFSPNTHLTGEALGLYYAGEIFRDWPQSEHWADLGARILTEQSERQILSDGVYFERATGYQRYTLEIYLHFLILAARNGRTIPSIVADRTDKMLDFLLAVRLPDGSVPQIGDADSGTLVPLSRRAQDDVRGVLSVAAVHFGRADCAWASSGDVVDPLWLLGPDALATFDHLRPAPPIRPPSRHFDQGGYVVMRNDWQRDGQMLIFDVGPLGGAGSAGHGHADLLSLQCAVFGEAFLVDAGTFCYTGDSAARDFFRGSASHSTVLVDGHSQASPRGPFQWSGHPRAELAEWHSTPELDFADADYRPHHLASGFARHRRRVLYAKGRYWVIVDDLEGEGDHQVDLRFQFAPVELRLDGAWRASARSASGQMLVLHPFCTRPRLATVHCGELDPMQGWISREYGQRQPAPVLQYRVHTSLPFRIATVIAPVGAGRRAPVVSAVFDDKQTPVGIVFDETGERLSFGDSGMPWLERCAPVATVP